MLVKDIEDLWHFVEELKKETDRGLPLVGAALIDSKLSEILFSFFCEGKSASRLLAEGSAPLGTFSSRIEICFALGLIDDFEYKEAHLIRKIRNEFAHEKHGISFKTEKIARLCSSLNDHLPEDATYSIEEPRPRFINSVMHLVLRLYYRPAYIAEEKRKATTWVNPNSTRWRRIDDKRPPERIPIIVGE